MTPLVLTIAGVLLLIFSIWAWRRNGRFVASEMPPLWSRVWRWRWLIGGAVGIASCFLSYSIQSGTQRYTVYGIPFVSYVFDGNGRDYVGALTLPALVLNVVTWALVPQLVLWEWVRRRKA